VVRQMEMLTYAVGLLCYVVGTVFGIRLRDDVRIPTAAALAPTVAVLGQRVDANLIPLTAVALIVAALVLRVAGRRVAETVSHLTLLLGCFVVIPHLTGGDDGQSLRAVLVALAATGCYAMLEVARQVMGTRRRADIGSIGRMGALPLAVLMCASGLTILIVPRMGWPAFVAMAAVLALTKGEFEAFAGSRRAYDQTIRALDRLAEQSPPA
jgi:hypothetical protein